MSGRRRRGRKPEGTTPVAAAGHNSLFAQTAIADLEDTRKHVCSLLGALQRSKTLDPEGYLLSPEARLGVARAERKDLIDRTISVLGDLAIVEAIVRAVK